MHLIEGEGRGKDPHANRARMARLKETIERAVSRKIDVGWNEDGSIVRLEMDINTLEELAAATAMESQMIEYVQAEAEAVEEWTYL